jgi:sugar-specific transcriptional regulator TrmB
MDPMDRAIAENLGLTYAEAKTYLRLLELGPSNAGAIVKKVGLHRGSTYAILHRLIEKGLVSYIKQEKKTVFVAQEPDRLLEILKEKQQQISLIVPELKRIKSTIHTDLAATIYSGKKAIESVLDEMLAELKGNGEYYDFGVSKLLKEALGGYFLIFHTKRKRWGVKAKVIFDEEVRKNGEMLTIYQAERRFFPKKYFAITDTIIFKDRVILFICTSEPPLAIVIRNQPTANSYRNLFDFMWTKAKA